jgi:hypothetical protein
MDDPDAPCHQSGGRSADGSRDRAKRMAPRLQGVNDIGGRSACYNVCGLGGPHSSASCAHPLPNPACTTAPTE